MPVLVLPLHGHLAPAAWAAAQAAPGLKVGYVQTGGGALPGSLSRDVAELRERGLLCGHITAAPAYGGEHEAISVAGALDAAANKLGWDAVIAGPGPGIIGSDTPPRPRRHGRPGHRPRLAGSGLADLLSPRLSCRRPPRAPPASKPPHADRDATAAGCGGGAGSCQRAGADRGPRHRSRLAPPPPRSPGRPRWLRSIRPARRGRWAAASRRTRSSSPQPSLPAGPSDSPAGGVG